MAEPNLGDFFLHVLRSTLAELLERERGGLFLF